MFAVVHGLPVAFVQLVRDFFMLSRPPGQPIFRALRALYLYTLFERVASGHALGSNNRTDLEIDD